MKNILLLITVLSSALCCQAQITSSDFVTIWKTDNAPDIGSGSREMRIPAWGQYTVYYESTTGNTKGMLPRTGFYTDAQLITLPAKGTYRIAIRPAGQTPFHRIQFAFYDNYSDANKLLDIEQWGSTVWSSMDGAFMECRNLTTISAKDVPDLSKVTSLSAAFYACTSLVNAPSMNNWDVRNVTDMGFLFAYSKSFNQSLDNWDVGHVTNMRSMFQLADAFNQPLNDWDVSRVTDMGFMFNLAVSFNQPLDKWDVSHVQNMDDLFTQAYAFNQPLGNWNIRSLISLHLMFYDCAMDCENFSKTLIGWANNASTPNGLYVYTTRSYGPAAQDAYNRLTTTKNWYIDARFDPACVVSLPVHLISFTARASENDVHLQWTTSWEENSKGFDIERSCDGKQWTAIGFLPTATNSNSLRVYHFTDFAPLDGENLYRLKMMDYATNNLGETFTYSRIRSINFGGHQSYLIVYPNPAKQLIRMKAPVQLLGSELTLLNISGVITCRYTITNTDLTIDIGSYLPGVYFVKTADGSMRRVVKD